MEQVYSSLSLSVSSAPSLLHLLVQKVEEKRRLFGDQIWSEEKQSEKDLLVIVDQILGGYPTSQKERECVRMTFSLSLPLCLSFPV